MIVSQNGTIVGGGIGGTPASYSLLLAPSAAPVVVEHPLGVQPSSVAFVDAGGIPHEVDWTCDTAFPFAVHLAAIIEAGTLTIS